MTTRQSGLPGLFLDSTSLDAGVAAMDGQAQMFVIGLLTVLGAAEMDGQAQMVASRIAVFTGAPEMDGRAQMAATGATRVIGTVQMDGVGTMVVPHPLGAGVAQMDGSASMLVAGVRTGAYQASWQDSVHLATSYKLGFVQKLQDAIVLPTNLTTHMRYYYVFTDPINMQPTAVPSWRAILQLAQSVGVSQTISQKFTWGRILTEIVNISDIVSARGIYKRILAQLFKFVEAFKLSRSITLSQSIHLTSSLAITSFLKLLQNFLVASASSPVFHYHLALVGRMIVGDILNHFAKVVLAQLFTVHPAISRQFVTSNSLAQLLTVHPALNNKLILQLVGNVQLSPSQLVRAIYAGDELLDGVVITALYVSPSGTTTTWAVNTRTNAVTEYMNYNFRSFAQMGNRYIAAGAEGLYELDGNTDDGASIIAEMMSGYLQLNEKKLFGIKGAYIAIRGGGRFYLKLISGDGREYVYELRTQPNLMTTKVRVGKGISTTYMAFDLVTEGQDFDLDSIEFIPMTRGRRV